MSHTDFFALCLFAFSASISPGPNNIIASNTASQYGWRAVLPHILGVPCGFASMLILTSIGLISTTLQYPVIRYSLHIFGVGYLLYLAWLISRPSLPQTSFEHKQYTPFSFTESFFFQYANPKAWILAIATPSTLSHHIATANPYLRMTSIIFVFSLCVVISLLVWANIGAKLKPWLMYGHRLLWFNRCMGLALATSALSMLSF